MDLVMYSMENCPYCKHFRRIFVNSIPDGKIITLDRNDDTEWIERGIEFVPTVVAYEEGKEVDRLSAVSMVGIRYPIWKDWVSKYGLECQ